MLNESSILTGFVPDAVVAQLPNTAKVYAVGGCVRDALMGRPQKDRDWVVVGASVGDMEAAGFQPVGADFPVFLHPVTKEEYALARTERKSGVGYKGFTFYADGAVSLEADLHRRDFTINAMAMAASGELTDPYGGLIDLHQRRLRHVSEAFAEDPLRVLRLGRFLSRYTDFEVAPDTLGLCRDLVVSGELKHLTAERVYTELNRAFSESMPSRMLVLLTQLDAWPSLLGESWSSSLFADWGQQQLCLFDALLMADSRWAWALGAHLDRDQIKAAASRLRLPAHQTELAQVYCRIARMEQLDPQCLVGLFADVDVYRKPERVLICAGIFRQEATFAEQSPSSEVASPSRGAVVSLLVLAAEQVISGQYKESLRSALSGLQGPAVAAGVADFRLRWVHELLKTQNR